jgi:hypothetical protein
MVSARGAGQGRFLMSLILGLIIYIACIVGSASIGSRKGRPALGIVLGIVLGLIGVLIIALVPARRGRYY